MKEVRRGAASALLGLTLALAGCTAPFGAPIPAVPGGSTTSVATASAAPATAPASSPQVGLPADAWPTPTSGSTAPPVGTPTTRPTRRCSDRVLTARSVHLKGSRESVYWDLEVPQFEGAASAAEVNRHVRASAQDAVDLGKREGQDDAGQRRDVEGKATVTTSDRRTVQVELRWSDYLTGTAHPTLYVATTAVTTEEGRPLRLRDVLADVPSALRTIARAVDKEARSRGEDVTDRSGLAPKESNFAAWQTTRQGMRFTFGDYQLGGHGLRAYTVPWRTVRPLLSAYGTGLLDPDVDPSTC